MTSTAASSRDTAASMVVGCRSVTSSTGPPSVQAVTVPPSKPSTIASSPPTKNPRSSSWPSCEKCSQPSTLCSAIVLHGSHDPPEPTTQLLTRSPRRRGRAERYPQIFGWRHDPRSYLFFYTLDRTSPLPRSNQEARIPDQRPLVQSPPISRHPEALRRYRRANCCPYAIRSVEPYQGHYRHTLCATFPRRQSREWRTRTQCEPGRVFDF